MKGKISLMVLMVCVSVSLGAWHLVWQDEFDYSGLPDPNKWGYDVGNGGWGNNELQNYTANRTENARVENGNLILEARRDWFDGIEYSSARLVSRHKGDWLYGRIEVRAKIPLGQGLWPAIWMLPTDWEYGGWPASGEIDIMENFALGGIKPYQIEGNIHTQSYNHSIGTNKGASMHNLSNIEDNYHTYAVNWYEDKLDFEVDGTIYFTFWNEGNWQAWPYDKRFHLIMNIAVGGTLGTTPDPNIFPKRMIVDYVRVYSQEQQIEPSTGLVTIYRDDQYNGFSAGLHLGEYTLSALQDLGMSDNDVTSLRVPEGIKVTLYDGDNFTGSSTDITSDNGNLWDWNDKATSMRVTSNGMTGITGEYALQNKKSGLFLDATGGLGGTGDGVNIQQWHQTGADNQTLAFSEVETGIYRCDFKHSNRALDVAEVSWNNGANMQQWGYGGGRNQQYIAVDAGEGYIKLVTAHAGKVVEVAGGSTAPEANVQQWDNNDQDCAKWKLTTPHQTSVIKKSSSQSGSLTKTGMGIVVSGFNEDYNLVKVHNLHGQLLYEKKFNGKAEKSALIPTKILPARGVVLISVSNGGAEFVKRVTL